MINTIYKVTSFIWTEAFNKIWCCFDCGANSN